MHSYQHNIKTFNNATRHLTRVERSLYRDLIELYYDTEQPLPSVDFDRLARRVMAHSDDEKAALRFVLEEFFTLTGDVYTHDYCDEQIEKYRSSTSAKALAGKASAAARKLKSDERRKKRQVSVEQNPTSVQQPLNECATNQKPETRNQKDNSTELSTSGKNFPDPHPDDLRLAEFILAGVTEAVPKTKPPNLHKWADTIRLMRERDRLSLREIAEVFTWANRNAFWRLNILSPDKLREKFPKLSAQKEQDHANSIRSDQRNPSSVTEQSTVGRAAAAANRKRAAILARNGGGPGAGDGGSVGADGRIVRGEVVEAVR